MNSFRFNLTQANVAGAPSPEPGKRTYLKDTKIRGLTLMITPKGTKSFYVVRKFKGKTERVLIGRFPETKVTRARERAGEINAQFDAGLNVNDIKRAERGELTLGDLFGEYYDGHCVPHNRDPVKWAGNYHRYLSPWGNRRLSEIRKVDVQALIVRLKRDKGHRTANIALVFLRAMFNYALNVDLYDGRNPTTGIKKYKEVARDRFLFGHEMKRFMLTLKDMTDDLSRDFFLMLLLTGARKSNVLKMCWEDINLEDAVWRIPDTKIGEPQSLPLAPQALAVLKARFHVARKSRVRAGINPIPTESVGNNSETPGIISDVPGNNSGANHNLISELPGINPDLPRIFNSDPAKFRQIPDQPGTVTRFTKPKPVEKYVFPGSGADGHLKDPKRAWASLLVRAEITNFRMHDLRRTHGSYMAATGANQFVISRALGHKNLATTAIYARLDHDPIREAATNAIDVMLDGVHGILPTGTDYDN